MRGRITRKYYSHLSISWGGKWWLFNADMHLSKQVLSAFEAWKKIYYTQVFCLFSSFGRLWITFYHFLPTTLVQCTYHWCRQNGRILIKVSKFWDDFKFRCRPMSIKGKRKSEKVSLFYCQKTIFSWMWLCGALITFSFYLTKLFLIKTICSNSGT